MKDYEGYLKPCPFCGGEAHLWVGNPKLHMDSNVSCSKCHITQRQHYETSEQAIKAWNERV